ncbi:MAG: hypothetical protein K2K23_11510 [Muribaculaceae bacterium]|nr:hypothetical protein [Muribaculaceae bacterium]
MSSFSTFSSFSQSPPSIGDNDDNADNDDNPDNADNDDNADNPTTKMSVKTTLFPFGRKITTSLPIHQIISYVLQHISRIFAIPPYSSVVSTLRVRHPASGPTSPALPA